MERSANNRNVSGSRPCGSMLHMPDSKEGKRAGGVGVSHTRQVETRVLWNSTRFPTSTPLLSNAGLIGTNCLRACESERAPFGQGRDMLMGCYPTYLCMSKASREQHGPDRHSCRGGITHWLSSQSAHSIKSYICVTCQTSEGKHAYLRVSRELPSPNASSEEHRHHCYKLFMRL